MAIAWIAVGVLLIAVELHHLALYALFVAVGCLAAAVVAVVWPDALAVQVLVAVVGQRRSACCWCDRASAG